MLKCSNFSLPFRLFESCPALKVVIGTVRDTLLTSDVRVFLREGSLCFRNKFQTG